METTDDVILNNSKYIVSYIY